MDCLGWGGVGGVGWGGVGWGWWHSLNSNTWWMLRNCACLVIAHMVDATQLCGGVGWGGVGMMTFFELEHMVDATQLCLSCHCTHGGCYATVRWGGVGWGGDDDILWTRTHGGCYATVLVLSLHTWWMLRNCAVGWGGWGGDDDILWTWTHGGCYATVPCLVIAHMGNPGSWSRVLCNPVNTYGNCMMQSARGQQPGTWLFRFYRGLNYWGLSRYNLSVSWFWVFLSRVFCFKKRSWPVNKSHWCPHQNDHYSVYYVFFCTSCCP